MSITARAAADKISELRSKLAVYAACADVLNANYMPCDAGAPEAQLTREDGGLVGELHLRAVLEEFEQKCAELRTELEEWEGLVFEPATSVVRPMHPVTTPAPGKRATGERKLHGRRLHTAAK